MRKWFGLRVIGKLGAILWEKGGFWTCQDDYDNLTWYGKMGYNLFCKGFEIAGITPEMLDKMKQAR